MLSTHALAGPDIWPIILSCLDAPHYHSALLARRPVKEGTSKSKLAKLIKKMLAERSQIMASKWGYRMWPDFLGKLSSLPRSLALHANTLRNLCVIETGGYVFSDSISYWDCAVVLRQCYTDRQLVTRADRDGWHRVEKVCIVTGVAPNGRDRVLYNIHRTLARGSGNTYLLQSAVPKKNRRNREAKMTTVYDEVVRAKGHTQGDLKDLSKLCLSKNRHRVNPSTDPTLAALGAAASFIKFRGTKN